MNMPFRIAVNPAAPAWDASLDRSFVPGAYLCGGCESDQAFVITSADVETVTGSTWYGHCSMCGHTVFLGEAPNSWVPGPLISDVLAAELQP